MFTLIGIVIIIISLFLTLIVLIQNPKGGVLSSSFGSMGNQILGANRSTDVIEKITWYLAGGLMVLSVVSLFLIGPATKGPSKPQDVKSELEEELKKKGSGLSLPSAPAQPATQAAPVQGQQTAPATPAAQQPSAPKK